MSDRVWQDGMSDRVWQDRFTPPERGRFGDNERAGSKPRWIPHSKVEVLKKESILPGVRRNGQTVRLACIVVTMPEWLAREKGLI